MEQRHSRGNQLWCGIAFCVVIGVIAWFMAEFIPVAGSLIGGPVFAIILGMLFAARKRPECAEPGIRYAAKMLLQYSIIFIGFGMDIGKVLRVGGDSMAVMLCTIAASLITAYLIGRVLQVPSNACILIGVGTSICGGSAIAATAPVIEADDREVAYAISTIFLFNIAAVFLFPALGRLFGMTDTGFGMWAGTAINDTSSVVAAGYSFSDEAGNYATIVKLTRTLMIIPITLALAFWRVHKAKAAGMSGSSYSLKKIFPWFVLGFLATAILNTVLRTSLPASIGVLSFLNDAGKFGIIVAMAGIGLNTNIKKLFQNGLRPIVLGLCCWFVVATVALAVQNVLGLV